MEKLVVEVDLMQFWGEIIEKFCVLYFIVVKGWLLKFLWIFIDVVCGLEVVDVNGNRYIRVQMQNGIYCY